MQNDFLLKWRILKELFRSKLISKCHLVSSDNIATAQQNQMINNKLLITKIITANNIK